MSVSKTIEQRLVKAAKRKLILWIGGPAAIAALIGLFFLLIIAAVSGGISSESGSGENTSGSRCQAKENITSSFLNEKLRGKGAFEGMGGAFLQASEKHKVDPILVIAIAFHETGNGQSKAVKDRNNPGGLMTPTGLMKFPTLEEGIDRMVGNLQRLYISQGLTTVETIQRKYAPVGASNDPTNLNSHWVTGVKKYINDLGGLTYECTPTPSNDPSTVMANLPGKKLMQPLFQMRMTSPFNPHRMHPIHKVVRPHTGADFGAATGTPVYAAESGTIRFSGTMGGYGNIVIIDHGGGLSTRYAHLSARSVSQGQSVKRGQIVGKVGSTGTSTNPHLHFEVRINDTAVNPMPYIK